MGYIAILISAGASLVMTVLVNSSTASTAIIMIMAFNGIVTYEMAAGMILGANLGTTANALLASVAGNADARRAALVHFLFNVVGIVWALHLVRPLLGLVSLILPGNPWADIPENPAIPIHLAGLHTTFNIINTALFLPFVSQFARLVSFIVRDKQAGVESGRYRFAFSAAGTNSPEFNILRVEKEIRDMAGIVSFMYSRFSAALQGLRETGGKDREDAATLFMELQKQEEHIDEMRDELSGCLFECSRAKLNAQSENHVSYLLRVIGDLEEMSDECYSISRLLEKSVRKNCVFKNKEMDDLVPYVGLVGEFLALLERQLGNPPTAAQAVHALELETSIDKSRKKLHRLGLKRIEAGKDVRTELLFIELVRRIERLGDYCFDIMEAGRPGGTRD
jgi:phosphate:Na+ symporter